MVLGLDLTRKNLFTKGMLIKIVPIINILNPMIREDNGKLSGRSGKSIHKDIKITKHPIAYERNSFLFSRLVLNKAIANIILKLSENNSENP